MIILVKINRTYIPGHDPKIFASGEWVSAKLLDDPSARKKYRYLVAYAHKKILGVYCIAGVGQVIGKKPRRVYFDLRDMNPECEAILINMLQAMADENHPEIVNRDSIRFLDAEHFPIPDHFITQKMKCCGEDEMALLEPMKWETPEIDTEPVRETDSKLWYKMTVDYHSFDSFRSPVAVHIHSIAQLNPTGSINYQRLNDATGSMKIISRKLDPFAKKTLLRIFGLFEHNPRGLYNAIDTSNRSAHVAHVNSISITIESFRDAAHTSRVQHISWSGNLIIAHSGVLKTIFDIMVR